MGTLSLVSEYLNDLEECMDDGDSRVAKEAKLFDALEHKSVVIEVDNKKIAIFTKAQLWAFGEPFMRYSLPCKVDGQGAWDAELDLTDLANYATKKVLENIGFVHVSLSDYGRKMVNDVNVEIHGVKFKADFVVLDYVNEGEPSILLGRDFLAITKSQVDFGLGEIRMNITKFEEGIDVIGLLEEVGSSSEEGKMKEVLDIKYKELEESKPNLEVLENYVMYKKKLDEILICKERINKKEFSEEDKVGITEHSLPKKMCDPRNYVLPVKINGVVEMVALVDTGASVSVLPYSLYKDLRLGDPRPYQTNLKMADNTQAKAMGELKNLPLLLGRPFLITCRAIIDMGRGILCIYDGVICHTYFPKPQSKSYVEAFEMEGEDDWLGSFKVERDKDGNVKYGSVAPSFIDIKDDMERALAMEAYFNLFKNVIVFKKLVDFLDSLPVQLKNLDWGNEGYGTYKKVDGDGDWHARLEVNDKQFNHKDYWTRVGKPTLTNHKEVFVKEPLMRIVHKVTVGSLVHRMLADKLDVENTCLKKETEMPTQAEEGSSEPRHEHGGLNSRGSYGLGGDDYFTSTMPDFGGSSSGYAAGGSFRGSVFNDDDDMDE
ncbi:hypothetical protein Tco_1016744 [Tanacetum coccineum]|uniref:Uncharacterized protein n=1 Tax=Tanacetum coccineum TaxID=301880 RepID=A0ABQ5FQ23_9ASTR